MSAIVMSLLTINSTIRLSTPKSFMIYDDDYDDDDYDDDDDDDDKNEEGDSDRGQFYFYLHHFLVYSVVRRPGCITHYAYTYTYTI